MRRRCSIEVALAISHDALFLAVANRAAWLHDVGSRRGLKLEMPLDEAADDPLPSEPS